MNYPVYILSGIGADFRPVLLEDFLNKICRRFGRVSSAVEGCGRIIRFWATLFSERDERCRQPYFGGCFPDKPFREVNQGKYFVKLLDLGDPGMVCSHGTTAVSAARGL